MYTTNLEPAASILSVLCLIYVLTTKRRQYRPPKGLKAQLLSQHFVFMLLLLVSILTSAVDNASIYLLENRSGESTFFLYLMLEIYFLLHNSLAMLFVLYIMNVNGTAIGRKKRFYWFYITPYCLGQLVVLTSPLTGLCFYLDAAGAYQRGVMMPALYCMAAIYVFTGLYFFIRYQRAIPRADSIAICAVVVFSLAGVVVQALRPDLVVELFGETLTILGLMIMLEDRTGATDPVTLVFNRRAFIDTNRRLMETDQSYRIILIKLLNLDRLSRLFTSRDADKLMVALTDWLETVAEQEQIFRYRPEIFALIRRGRDGEQAEALAERILRRLREPWKTDEADVHLEAVVSVIRVPEDVDSLSLLQDLLIGGYQDSRPGSLPVTHDELAALTRKLAVEDALRRALTERTLQIWYQPIWSAEAERVVAAEALSRLFDGKLGAIPPDEFIPIAEKTGMIHELGVYVFGEVCRMLGARRLKEKGIKYIEVNISLYQLLRKDILTEYERLREAHGVEAAQINLEVTESVSSEETPDVSALLRQMSEAGYTFSLDDYGTGYSNFARLLENNYTNVKIDKSLLWGGEKNPDTARLLGSMIRVIRSLDINVIQEGVETKEQLDRVINAGCNLVQGYYFSRPLREEDFIAYLEKAQPAAASAVGGDQNDMTMQVSAK